MPEATVVVLMGWSCTGAAGSGDLVEDHSRRQSQRSYAARCFPREATVDGRSPLICRRLCWSKGDRTELLRRLAHARFLPLGVTP